MEVNIEELELDIIRKQNELMLKYAPMEGIPDWPFNIDDKEHQIWIKDFFWRITEEYTEYLDAIIREDMSHAREELSDCLHFYTEVAILLGCTNIIKLENELYGTISLARREIVLKSIHYLGKAGNCLKNKKWKQSLISTDVDSFLHHFRESFKLLIRLFNTHGKQANDIHYEYFRKHKINKKRQDSNY